MIERIHHVGLAVADLDSAIDRYQRGFGMRLLLRDRSSGEVMDFALLGAGDAELELMHSDDSSSAVGKFLAQRGEGIHHVAYAVPDLDAALSTLTRDGFEVAGEPRVGVHGSRVAFLHPKSVGGVLTELVESPAHGTTV